MKAQVGLLAIVFDIPESNSLKDKRSVLSGMIASARKQLHLSIAEIGMHNRIRCATVAICFVAPTRGAVDRARAHAEDFFSRDPRLVPVEFSWEWL